ncbi:MULTISPECIES: Ig-like domain-containing protein [unclassified Pseudonocardia]|uniref:L,D-transpeptidase n=1 Tax=unclassified Pseudonocardia TaxID=2619320 RepID=UPI000B1BA4C0|nr:MULTISPECIES: Ig-like domain-containing protein [unclassified Pseudonocardia]
MAERARKTGGRPAAGSGRRLAALIAALVATVLVSGCATAAARATHEQRQAQQTAPPVPASLSPADGTADVSPKADVKADGGSGTLRDIALTNAKGVAVTGELSADGKQWAPTEPLGYGGTYTWSGTAVATDGTTTPLAGSFTTVTPTRTVKATTNIGDGATVGVAAPIEVQFNRDLDQTAKAAVEKTLKVTTSVPVEGAWAWLPDDQQGSRAHWRPKEYWPAGTQVTMTASVYGVDMGSAGYGAADLSSEFTIGRSQIVKADVTSHRIVVIRDGQQVLDLPASYGLETDPNRVTRSGTHIVMGKSETVLMTNLAYGYENIPEKWAVRISNNGEFIHANPASAGAQGNRNVTHGCINLSLKNAKTYFDTAMFGDPVEVTGSSVKLSAADGDIYDWAVDWSTWQSMSALSS